MRLMQRLGALSLVTLSAALPLASWADAGHDHGPSAPAQSVPGLPRFSAVSETFELVGVLNGKQLSLYLDRADDNSPVKNAQLELEWGGAKLTLKAVGEGEFEATLPQEPKPGVTAVAATVLAGQESDLLAGELTIQDAAPAGAATAAWPWKTYGSGALAGLLGLGLLGIVLRRWRAHRINRT